MNKGNNYLIKLIKSGEAFRWKDIAAEGATQYELNKLLESGELERVARGLYRGNKSEDGGQWEILANAAKRLDHQSAVCLLSALEFHHLTEALPKDIWMMVDSNTRTIKKGLRLFRRRDPMWQLGIEKKPGFLVTNLERTLAEVMAHRTKCGSENASYALRRAIQGQATTPDKILDMADKLGLLKRVFSQIEMLAYG